MQRHVPEPAVGYFFYSVHNKLTGNRRSLTNEHIASAQSVHRTGKHRPIVANTYRMLTVTRTPLTTRLTFTFAAGERCSHSRFAVWPIRPRSNGQRNWPNCKILKIYRKISSMLIHFLLINDIVYYHHFFHFTLLNSNQNMLLFYSCCRNCNKLQKLLAK